MRALAWLAAMMLAAAELPAAETVSTGAVVRLRPTARGLQLERRGAPFVVKGANGSYRLDRLVEAGGNTVRTTPALLDRTQALGLAGIVTLPLESPRSGFDYGDTNAAQGQFEGIRSLVRQYRSHPALLLWSLGNEPEAGVGASQRTGLWKEVNRLAAMIKAEDPNHPVIVVLGEGYRRMLRELDQHCPALDAVGLNAHQDLLSLPEDLARQGWRRPYLLTEMGVRTPAQAPRSTWRAALEETSSAKAAFLLQAYRHAVEGATNCLGACVSFWGFRPEITPTWSGLFLADGNRTESLDALTFLWTGRWPRNRCPQIGADGIRCRATNDRRMSPGDVLNAGRRYEFEISVTDPEGDALAMTWELRVDAADDRATGAEDDAAADPLDGAIVEARPDGRSATVQLPNKPGNYRLFVYVYDGHGNAATANVPLFAVMAR